MEAMTMQDLYDRMKDALHEYDIRFNDMKDVGVSVSVEKDGTARITFTDLRPRYSVSFTAPRTRG